MKKLIPLCLLALLITACGGGTKDNRREVEKEARDHAIIPIDATDKALRTEAVTAMGIIHRQVKLKAATLGSGERSGFYSSISGNLDDAKCQKLGLSASTLKGTYYIASDYHLGFSGNQMTITVAKPGTRGRVEPKTFTVP